MPNTTMMTLVQGERPLPVRVAWVKTHEPSCILAVGYGDLTIHFDSPGELIDWCRRAIAQAERLSAAVPVEFAAVAEPAYAPTLGNVAEKQSKLLIREFAPGITIVDVLPANDMDSRE